MVKKNRVINNEKMLDTFVKYKCLYVYADSVILRYVGFTF